MNIIFLTLGVSISIAILFLFAFIWSARKGQYDDLETPSHRILLDDIETETKNIKNTEDTNP